MWNFAPGFLYPKIHGPGHICEPKVNSISSINLCAHLCPLWTLLLGHVMTPISTYRKQLLGHVMTPISTYRKQLLGHVMTPISTFRKQLLGHVMTPISTYRKQLLGHVMTPISTFRKRRHANTGTHTTLWVSPSTRTSRVTRACVPSSAWCASCVPAPGNTVMTLYRDRAARYVHMVRCRKWEIACCGVVFMI